ncbi:MAG TPA: histidine kinase, partial [Gemmatimonadaceae bacterium]
ARLDYLEAQLQPHFLFNSLGAVSELAYDAPATATRVLRQLAAIFRTALARKTDEITLGDEIVGIEPYLDIQRIRFADWLTIDYRVDDDAVDCLVPRFVLQPLVENAIRHGLSGRSAAGVIEIVASVVGDELIVRVVDNGVGLERAAASSGRGIGLANVRDRLLILYGDDDRLSLTANGSGGTVAELRIPARRRDAVSTTAEHAAAREVIAAEHEDRAIEIPAWLQRRAVSIPFVWFICGVMWTQQSFLYLLMRGQLAGATWLSLAKSDMVSAFVWALFTPIILFITETMPLRRERLGLRISAYLVLTGVATIAHVALWHMLAAAAIPLFAPETEMMYIVGILVFATIVAVGHRRRLLDWIQSREATAAELRQRLDEAQQRATKLQSIPPVLLHVLDGIGETARHDPELTERQLTVLADYLRIALECTDARGVTPERERLLDLALAALRQTGAYSRDLTLSV